MASLCRAQIWQSSAVEKAGKRTQAMRPSAVASRERIHIIRQSSSSRAISMERLPATSASGEGERFAAIAYVESSQAVRSRCRSAWSSCTSSPALRRSTCRQLVRRSNSRNSRTDMQEKRFSSSSYRRPDPMAYSPSFPRSSSSVLFLCSLAGSIRLKCGSPFLPKDGSQSSDFMSVHRDFLTKSQSLLL